MPDAEELERLAELIEAGRNPPGRSADESPSTALSAERARYEAQVRELQDRVYELERKNERLWYVAAFLAFAVLYALIEFVWI